MELKKHSFEFQVPLKLLTLVGVYQAFQLRGRVKILTQLLRFFNIQIKLEILMKFKYSTRSVI